MKKRMEDELWMRKIKERLEDYSEPLPVSGWERLEKDLSAPKLPAAGKRRIIPFRRWAVAAAASLLIVVSSVSVWLLQSPVGEEMRGTAVPALAIAPDRLPEQQTPSIRTEITEPDYRAQKQVSSAGTNRRSLLAQQLDTAGDAEQTTKMQPLDTEPEIQESVQEQTVPVTKKKMRLLQPEIIVRRNSRLNVVVRPVGINCNCRLVIRKKKSHAAGRSGWLWEIRAD